MGDAVGDVLKAPEVLLPPPGVGGRTRFRGGMLGLTPMPARVTVGGGEGVFEDDGQVVPFEVENWYREMAEPHGADMIVARGGVHAVRMVAQRQVAQAAQQRAQGSVWQPQDTKRIGKRAEPARFGEGAG
jgi:hypothetical protein